MVVKIAGKMMNRVLKSGLKRKKRNEIFNIILEMLFEEKP